MKTPFYKFITALIFLAIIACSSNDNENDMGTDDDIAQTDDDPKTDDGPVGGAFEMVDVQIRLPEASNLDPSSGTLVSLGAGSSVDAEGKGSVPMNLGTIEVAYLLDTENNVLLSGFISEERKEVSVETTAELMVYYALGYHLLPESAKAAFVKGVQQVPGFTDFVNEIQTLFNENPLMYSAGDYETALQGFLDRLSAKAGQNEQNRISFNEESSKSGVHLSSVDSTHIKLQNSLPRRSKVLIYKKGYTDRNGDSFDVPNYTSSPFTEFELASGGSNTIQELEVGNSLQQINAQQASIDNAVETEPILLPVNPASEFVAAYEVVVIGSGQANSGERDMTEAEQQSYAQINKKTYVIDYFLPTLLDISGNKSLLPPFGSSKENALYNAVLPVLEQYPEVIDEVVENEFKAATELFLPALYGNVRLTDDLREILRSVYGIISGNGDFPNTFIQDHEMANSGYPRTQRIMAAIDKNIKATNYYANYSGLRTTAFNFERWEVKSIDAVVEMQRDQVELCLGQATELRVSIMTDYDPEVEEFEFHWSTSNDFGGRVQDIGGDPNNFGTSIVTTNNYVSYISTALESALGGGDNVETVTVVLFFRNKNTGELTEAGRDSMTVNNKKGCESFTASFVRLPNVREISSLSCPNDIAYQAFSPVPFGADFAAVDGAVGYKGIITASNGVVNQERIFDLEDLEAIGNGMLRINSGVGSIRIFNSCDAAEAATRAQEYVAGINVQPSTIMLTPIFD